MLIASLHKDGIALKMRNAAGRIGGAIMPQDAPKSRNHRRNNMQVEYTLEKIQLLLHALADEYDRKCEKANKACKSGVDYTMSPFNLHRALHELVKEVRQIKAACKQPPQDTKEMIEDPEMSFHNDSPASFLFCLKEAKTDWVMKITKNGIEFNREGFPDWTPDDFANNVMDILEKSLRLKGTAIPKLVELDINMNKE